MADSVVIFGGNGFVGRRLAEHLIEHDTHIVALVRHPPSIPIDGVHYVVAPFDTPDHFAPWLAQARVIVHAAAQSTPGSTAGQPLIELQRNLTPTLALLDALQTATHCALLYLSSGGALYGDTGSRPATEYDPPHPKSYYGAGKAAAELFIEAACQQFPLAATIVRPSNLYGAGQSQKSGFGLIPTAFNCIAQNQPLTVWGNGSATRDYLFIDDFLTLCQRLIAEPMPTGLRRFNASAGQNVSLLTMIEHIRCVTGAMLPVIYHPARAVDIEHIALDNHTARTILRWQPTVALTEGLQRTWHWWQNQS